MCCACQENCNSSCENAPYGHHANGRERLRTVVNGRENKRNVERTYPQPQTPRVKLEPLLRIREKSRVSNFKTTIKSQLFPLNLHSSQNLFFGINPPLKTQYFPLNLQKQIPGTANDQFKVGVVMDDLFSVKRPLPPGPFSQPRCEPA